VRNRIESSQRRLATLCAVAALVLAATGGSLSVPRAQEADSPAVDPNAVQPPIKQGSRLQGRTYLDRNREVVGATVLVQPQDDTSRTFVTSSDEKGRFRVDDLPDGTYRVEVEREGLQPIVKKDVSLRFPFRAVIELPMQKLEIARSAGSAQAGDATPAPTGAVGVEGRVAALGGEPVEEVAVRFIRVDGTADPFLVRTATDGRFELTGLKLGAWRLEVRGVGYLPIRTALNFREDAIVDVAMVPQPAEYDPSPLELMPPEEPIAPADLPEVLVVE
jgi:hypothetical protein